MCLSPFPEKRRCPLFSDDLVTRAPRGMVMILVSCILLGSIGGAMSCLSMVPGDFNEPGGHYSSLGLGKQEVSYLLSNERKVALAWIIWGVSVSGVILAAGLSRGDDYVRANHVVGLLVLAFGTLFAVLLTANYMADVHRGDSIEHVREACAARWRKGCIVAAVSLAVSAAVYGFNLKRKLPPELPRLRE